MKNVILAAVLLLSFQSHAGGKQNVYARCWNSEILSQDANGDYQLTSVLGGPSRKMTLIKGEESNNVVFEITPTLKLQINIDNFAFGGPVYTASILTYNDQVLTYQGCSK